MGLKRQLRNASERGVRFVAVSTIFYSGLLENAPESFKLLELVCHYTAGWACGSVLSYMIAIAGRPQTLAEEEVYNNMAFQAVESACRRFESLTFMRGLSARDVSSMRPSPEFMRGYGDAYKEVVRLLTEDTKNFFPIGFKGYIPTE